MDGLNDFGVGEVPAFGQFAGLQAPCLQLGAGGTIKKQHLLS